MISSTKKILLIVFAFIMVCLLTYNVFWVVYLYDVPSSVRPALKAVLEAFYISRVSGGYWENEMDRQKERIATLPQSERVAFFKGIMLLTCDLDTSRATDFVNNLGYDAQALRVDLIRLRDSSHFRELSKQQQEIAIGWIVALDFIEQRQNWEKDMLAK